MQSIDREQLLPAGVHIRPDGPIATLAYDTPEAERAYRQLTAADGVVSVSLYLIDHWLPVLGPNYFAILVRLQCAARYRRDPAPSLPDLAAATKLSESTLRRFIAWWNHPQPSDLTWLAMRAYVQEIRPCDRHHGPGSATYQFSVLLDDVLHPKHWRHFEQLVAGQSLELQSELLLDDPRQGSQIDILTGVQGCQFGGSVCAGSQQGSQNETLTKAQGSQNGDSLCSTSQQGSQNDTLTEARHQIDTLPNNVAGSAVTHKTGAEGEDKGLNLTPLSPPHTPHACMHAAKHADAKQHACLESTYEVPAHPAGSANLARNESGSEGDTREAVLAALIRQGVPAEIAEQLCAQPNGLQWARKQLDWLPYRDGLANPTRFLVAAIRGACRGDVKFTGPPPRYLQRQEEAERREKSRARTASKISDQPFMTTAPVPADAAALWRRLIDLTRQRLPWVEQHVKYAHNAALENGTFILTARDPRAAHALQQDQADLLALLQQLSPDVAELRIAVKGASP